MRRAGIGEHLKTGRGTAAPGWVKDYSGVVGWRTTENGGKVLLGFTLNEFAIGNIALFHVLAGGEYALLIDIHANEGLNEVGKRKTEKADAAISIDEMPRSSGLQSVTDGIDEAGQKMEIVLEK